MSKWELKHIGKKKYVVYTEKKNKQKTEFKRKSTRKFIMK